MCTLENTGPDYGEISEADDFIDESRLVLVVALVVVEKVVGVFECRVLGVPHCQHYVHHCP